jgi:hypothetical protein
VKTESILIQQNKWRARFILIAIYFQGDEIKTVKMNGGGGCCCMHGGEERKIYMIMVGNLKGRDHMENLGTDEDAIL